MTKDNLLKEKANLKYKLEIIDIALNEENGDIVKFDTTPWHHDILWQVADIIRTSAIVNKNYPYGYDCNICQACGNKCTTDGDGADCNWAFMEYFEKELKRRGFYEGK